MTRYTGEIGWSFSGDKAKAQQLTGFARKIVGDLAATHPTVEQKSRTFTLHGGAVVRVWSMGYVTRCDIFVPTHEVTDTNLKQDWFVFSGSAWVPYDVDRPPIGVSCSGGVIGKGAIEAATASVYNFLGTTTHVDWRGDGYQLVALYNWSGCARYDLVWWANSVGVYCYGTNILAHAGIWGMAYHKPSGRLIVVLRVSTTQTTATLRVVSYVWTPPEGGFTPAVIDENTEIEHLAPFTVDKAYEGGCFFNFNADCTKAIRVWNTNLNADWQNSYKQRLSIAYDGVDISVTFSSELVCNSKEGWYFNVDAPWPSVIGPIEASAAASYSANEAAVLAKINLDCPASGTLTYTPEGTLFASTGVSYRGPGISSPPLVTVLNEENGFSTYIFKWATNGSCSASGTAKTAVSTTASGSVSNTRTTTINSLGGRRPVAADFKPDGSEVIAYVEVAVSEPETRGVASFTESNSVSGSSFDCGSYAGLCSESSSAKNIVASAAEDLNVSVSMVIVDGDTEYKITDAVKFISEYSVSTTYNTTSSINKTASGSTVSSSVNTTASSSKVSRTGVQESVADMDLRFGVVLLTPIYRALEYDLTFNINTPALVVNPTYSGQYNEVYRSSTPKMLFLYAGFERVLPTRSGIAEDKTIIRNASYSQLSSMFSGHTYNGRQIINSGRAFMRNQSKMSCSSTSCAAYNLRWHDENTTLLSYQNNLPTGIDAGVCEAKKGSVDILTKLNISGPLFAGYVQYISKFS